jgi:sugar lactone lactonase YvrE
VVTAGATGYESVTTVGDIAAGESLIFSPALVPVGSPPSDPTLTLRGLVVDSDTGAALSAVSVVVIGTSYGTLTDGTGGFELIGLSAGLYTLEVVKTGYLTAQYPVLAPEGGVVDLGFLRLLREEVPATTTLTGVVRDAESGAPVSGAAVAVDGMTGGVVSGADGTYRLEGIAAARFGVTATAVGYLTNHTEVSLVQNGAVALDLPLTRAAVARFDIGNVTATGTSFPAFIEVLLTASLNNTDTVDRTVSLWVNVVNSANEIVESYPTVEVPLGGDPASALLTVPPGMPLSATFEWGTASKPPGIYQVILQAWDYTTGRLLAERGIPLEIQPTTQVGGHVGLSPPITHVAANRPVRITADIINRGNEVIGPGVATATVSLRNAGRPQRTDLVSVESWISGQGLSSPAGSDLDTAGNLYVANTGGNNVLKITPSGAVTVFATGFSSPVDVDLDDAGNLYVLNSQNSFVRLSADGTRIQITTGLTSQEGIEAVPDGRVYIVRQNTLHEIGTDGTVRLVVSGGLSSPQGMVINSQGEIFIANSGDNLVSRYADGVLSTFVSGINQPYGITIDAQDNLYVTSFGANSLLRITPQGAVTTIATGLSGPYDVKIAPDGNFAVSNLNSHQIVRVTPGGAVSVWVEGILNAPGAAAYDGAGNLYVANTGSKNIVALRTDGTTQTVASGITSPNDLEVGSDGNLYLLKSGSSLSRILPGGTKTVLSTGLITAHSLAAAPDGNGFLVSEPNQNRIRRATAAGVVTTFMEADFPTPRSLRRDAVGNLYVVGAQGAITRIGTDGVVSRVVSGLSNPFDLAFTTQGDLIVSEYNTKRLVRVDPSGGVSTWAQLTFNPAAMAAAPDGSIRVAPWGGTTIYSVNSSGAVTAYATVTRAVYGGMLMDTAGTVWAAHSQSNGVTRIASNGAQTLYTVGSSPQAIAEDGLGGVYVGVLGGVQRITASGSVTNLITGGVLSGQQLVGLAIDSQGRIWVAGSLGVLTRYHPDLALDKRFGSLSQPKGLAVTGAGELLVANTTNGKILKVLDANTLPEVVGDSTFERITAEGGSTVLLSGPASVQRLDLATGAVTALISGFSSIRGVAGAPDGRIAVVDSVFNQLGLFSSSGAMIDRFHGLVSPEGLLFDSSGNLLVANGLPDGVSRVRADGRLEPFSAVTRITYLFLEPDGQIIGSRLTDIATLSAAGEQLSLLTTASGPRGLARGPDGNLYVVSNSEGALVQHETDGSYHKIASGLSNAKDIEKEASGRLMIADASRGVVLAVNQDESLSLLAENLPTAESIGVEGTGRFYVAYSFSKIARIETDGTQVDLPTTDVILAGLKDVMAIGETLYGVMTGGAIFRIGVQTGASEVQPGTVVYAASFALPELTLGGLAVGADFGGWTPTVSGDYLVEVTLPAGTLSNTLHVGPSAEGSLDLTTLEVAPGDRPVTAHLRVVGADLTQITQMDPSAAALVGLSGSANSYFGRGLAADSLGNIYSSDVNRIVKIGPSGAVSDFAVGVHDGHGLAVDSQDNLYAIKGTTIVKITPAGTVTTLAAFASDESVKGVAVGYDDRVYAVTGRNRLWRVNGEIVTTVGLNLPEALTVDGLGYFYTLNRISNAIVRISSDGLQSTTYFSQAHFEFEGINIAADCSNNLLMAPVVLSPFKASGEEDIIVEIVGDTGEVREVLHGPSVDGSLGDIDVLYYDRLGRRLLIWTEYGGKIFAFPLLCGGMDVEAHVVTLSGVDLSSADPPPTSVIPLGDGTSEVVWTLSQVTNQGSAIQLNLLFKGLSEGETRAAAKEAFLVFKNSFVPEEDVRVPIPIPSLLSGRSMSLSPALDAAQYGPNEMVALTVNVVNGGAEPFDGSLSLTIEDAAGYRVADLTPIPVTALAGFGSQLYTTSWNTGTTLAGSYQVRIELTGQGTVYAQAVLPFGIIGGTANGGQAAAQSTLTADKISYSSHETVTLTSTVTSQSVNTVLTQLEATIEVTNSTGNVLFAETRILADLLPLARTQWTSITDTGTQPAGPYTAILEVQSGGQPLTTATTSFTILSSLEQANALSGSIELNPTAIIERESTLLTYTLQNTGNEVDLPVITTEILIVDPDTGTPMRTLSGETSLNGKEVFADTILIDSTGLTPKPYLIVLRGTTAGVTQTLDSAGLTINPIPNHAPIANAGPDQLGFVGQPVTVDGTGSSDPDGDPITFNWLVVTVPTDSLITTGSLTDAAAPTPSFIPDQEGSYTLTLVVNDGLTDSQVDTVSVHVNPQATFNLHPETINLKSNGGSQSVTGVLTSPVLSSFSPFTAGDGVTVTGSFTLENQYTDQAGNTVTFTIPAEEYDGDDRIQPVDEDGDGDVDQYQLTLKFNRDLIIAGFKDAQGNLRITQPTELLSTVIGLPAGQAGNGIRIGSDTNTVISPAEVSKGGK